MFPLFAEPSKLADPMAHLRFTSGFGTKMLNQFFSDFFGSVVVFSQHLDGESLCHPKLNVRKTLMVLFGSKSPKAEAS
jgi:hypothetical protein